MPGYIGLMVDLQPQSLLNSGDDYEFGICISAGPVKDGTWPPFKVNTDLDLYCPWLWPWTSDFTNAAAGEMVWGVWVLHTSQPGVWNKLPDACCKLSLPPSPAEFDQYNNALEQSLAELQLVDSTGQWGNHADSKSFDALWKNPGNSIRDEDLPAIDDSTNSATPVVQCDGLMLFLSRRSIAHPPFNFGARLAWCLTLDRVQLNNSLGSYHWPEIDSANLRFCAFPYKKQATDPSVVSRAPLAGLEQNDTIGGSPAINVIVRAACNIASLPKQVPQGGPAMAVVELSHWRSQLVQRLAPFLDAPRLYLQLAIESRNGITLNWERWADKMPGSNLFEKQRQVIQRMWNWMIALSADLYTAAAFEKNHSLWDEATASIPGANQPPTLANIRRATASEWLGWLGRGVPNATQSQTTALSDLIEKVSRIAGRLTPDFVNVPPGATTESERSAMIAELDAMSQFLSQVHAREVVEVLLPQLWTEAGVNPDIVATVTNLLQGRNTNGPLPENANSGDDIATQHRNVVESQLGEALVWHWEAQLLNGAPGAAAPANEPKFDVKEQLRRRLGGDNGMLRLQYANRVDTGNGELLPKGLLTLGEDFELDLANAADSRLSWLIGDLAEPLREPHGITLPVATERLTPVGHVIESDDPLQREAGHVLFGRLAGQSWRCLNQAVLRLSGEKNLVSKIPLMVPIDLAFHDDHLRTTILYDNQPLSAPSGRANLIWNPNHMIFPEDNDLPRIQAPSYSFPQRNDAENQGILPHLTYGRAYNFVSLPISNAGILPKPLRRDGYPTLCDFKALATVDFTSIPQAVIYQTDDGSQDVMYLRRVGIGAPRIRVAGPDSTANWPVIPDDVAPLGAEVSPPEQGRPQEPLAVLFSDKVFSSSPRPVSALSNLQLEMRKPAVDIENWDRWTAKDLNPRERAPVWGRVFHERDHATSEQQKEHPDDPAVGDFLLIEIENLYPNSGAHSLWAVAYPAANLQDYQKLPVLCNISVGTGEPIVNQGKIEISVPAGQLVRITVHNLVSKKFLDGGEDHRLDKNVFPATALATQFPGVQCQGAKEVADSLDQWRACSSHVFRIEAATDELPAEETLWNALQPVADGDRVLVNLEYSRGFAFISAFDLKHQIWRWNGRPIQVDTVALPGTDVSEQVLSAWDGIGFHDRSNSQHKQIHGRLTHRDNTLPSTVLLYTDDRSNDHRAHYNRFGLTVYSRYYGVLKKSREARRRMDDQGASVVATGKGTSDVWRRLFHPARLRNQLKRPLVRALIPLTASGNRPISNPNSNPAGSPGFLLLLAEPFFEQAGIAEDLDCEVIVGAVDVKLSNDPTVTERQYFLEGGTDPVISNRAYTKLPVVDSQAPPGQKVVLYPPVGLTFDPGASDPLITSTCFFGYVPAQLHPSLQSANGYQDSSSANTFLKMRARRVIRSQTTALLRESGAEQSVARLASQWSESEWIRLLPDSNALLQAWPLSVNGSRIIRKLPAGASISGWKDPRPWSAQDASLFNADRFSYAILISRLAPDTSGRAREIYACAFRSTGNGNFKLSDQPHWPNELTSGPGYYARIIELFHRSLPDPSQNIWDTLFPNVLPDSALPASDVIARIERMSPSFNVEIAS